MSERALSGGGGRRPAVGMAPLLRADRRPWRPSRRSRAPPGAGQAPAAGHGLTRRAIRSVVRRAGGRPGGWRSCTAHAGGVPGRGGWSIGAPGLGLGGGGRPRGPAGTPRVVQPPAPASLQARARRGKCGAKHSGRAGGGLRLRGAAQRRPSSPNRSPQARIGRQDRGMGARSAIAAVGAAAAVEGEHTRRMRSRCGALASPAAACSP